MKKKMVLSARTTTLASGNASPAPVAKAALGTRRGSSPFFSLFLSHFLSSSSLFLLKNGGGGGSGGASWQNQQ
jgi:hypothetical protein